MQQADVALLENAQQPAREEEASTEAEAAAAAALKDGVDKDRDEPEAPSEDQKPKEGQAAEAVVAAAQAPPLAEEAEDKSEEKDKDRDPELQAQTPEAKPGLGADADKDSTVKAFCAASGGASKALARYIASFNTCSPHMKAGTGSGGLGQWAGKLGHQPPSKSYVMLKTLEELQLSEAEFRQAGTRQQLSNCTLKIKPHKAAIRELPTMSNAAGKRLTAAVEAALASKKKQQDWVHAA